MTMKKIGIPIFAVLALIVLLVPAHAKAGVRFGVTVGPPVYAYPPAYAYPYPYPYAYGYPYPSSYYYYSAPYRYPRYYSGFYWRGGRERFEHERREFRERGFRDGRRFRR